uniref:DNA helicase n=1 Tax=Strongyloides papillosus TaxID=174720 RepID=A0A0N5B5H1_STREA
MLKIVPCKDNDVIPKKRSRISIGIQDDECKGIEIGGVTVQFPGQFDPYPSQTSIMEAIITSLDNSSNALIESPTGSGKTMALLSSSIGWLKSYKNKIKLSKMNCKLHSNENNKENKLNNDESFDDNDNLKNEGGSLCQCTCMNSVKIFYATRTHKQIAQVIKELKRLPYCYAQDSENIHHTILSAKEQSCINLDVRKLKNINQKCRRINADEKSRCIFKTNFNRCFDDSNITTLNDILPVWDIEELNEYGTTNHICPHFAALKLFRNGADIVFCPFNYIIDPKIRDRMGIDLENSIVILDEAHNIENFSRSSSSFNFTEDEIVKSLDDVRIRRNSLKKLLGGDSPMDIMIEEYNIGNTRPNEQEIAYLTGCLPQMEYLLEFMNKLFEWFQNFAPEVLKEPIKMDVFTSKLLVYKTDPLELEKLKGALTCCSTIGYGENSVICSSTNGLDEWQEGDESYSEVTEGDFIGDRKCEKLKENCVVKLELWCLDPSLGFKDAFNNVRSIILASGTLSPIDTFISELGLKFESIVQGDQIIPKEQIFASVIGVGPNKKDIICTKNKISAGEQKNGNSVLFEIASLIVDVCENVKKGVLVFFPSYSMLEQVFQKISTSQLMAKLEKVKVVLREPRNSNSNSLNNVLMKYEKAIKQPESKSKSCTGSVIFAVYRGKFSEGIDFADDLARCVISIGIPLPNIGDPQVIEKKQFNNKFRVKKNLLPGDEWYKIDGYRALNQALGRCLRHRDDWGIIIMVDKRLREDIEYNSLDKYKISKWVVDNIKSYRSYEAFRKQMITFANAREKLSVPVKK